MSSVQAWGSEAATVSTLHGATVVAGGGDGGGERGEGGEGGGGGRKTSETWARQRASSLNPVLSRPGPVPVRPSGTRTRVACCPSRTRRGGVGRSAVGHGP